MAKDIPPRTEHLQTLNEIGRVVSSTLDLRTLYDTMYTQIGRVMDTTHFFVCLHDRTRNLLTIPYLREEGVLFLDQEMPFGDSVTSLVVERGEPLLFEDDAEYARYAAANGVPEHTVGEKQSEAKMYVPLSTGNRTLGALSVQSDRKNVYTDDDVRALLVLAAQAAVAIVNARLYEDSQESVRQTQALVRVAQVVNSSLDRQKVLDTILTGMRDVLPYRFAAVLLPLPREEELEIAAALGPPEAWEQVNRLRQEVRIPFGKGVTGRVFQTGRAQIVPDVTRFDGRVANGLGDMGSEMAVPLRRGDDIVGVLDVERSEIAAFSRRHLDLFSLFASQAATAIENARLFSRERSRVFELQAIQTILQKLTPLHEVPAIAKVINRELKQLIDYHASRLFLLESDGHTLTQISPTEGDSVPVQLEIGRGFAGWITLHGKADIIADSLKDGRVQHIPGTPRRSESVIGAPLVYEGKVRGAITCSKLGVDCFDENQLRLLEIIAAQTAIVIDRARLYEELRTQAITDPLTEVYNRRYLIERLKEEVPRSIRHDRPLVAIMVDIDDFKEVNDRFGHDAGDVVLQELAKVVRREVRTEDIVARYGGEEFSILLPDVSPSEAEQVAERLRKSIGEHRLAPDARVKSVKVSVGMTVLQPEDRETQLFTRADQAMYRAKHSGGNRVCIAEGGEFRFYDEPSGVRNQPSAVSR